jgi:hypothetical protein
MSAGDLRSVKPAGSGDPRPAPDDTRDERQTTHATSARRHTRRHVHVRPGHVARPGPPAGARCSFLPAARGSSSDLSVGTFAERRPLTKRKALVLKRSNGIAYHARARNELKYWSPSCALLSKATSRSHGHNARDAARSADAQPRPIRCLARSLPGAEPYCERKQACGRWSLDGGGGMRPLLSC